MRYLLILLILPLLASGGCSKLGGCLTFSGEYKGAGGSVTYCPDNATATKYKVPVFEATDENGESVEKFFGFSPDEIKKIWDEIRGKEEKPKAGEEMSAMSLPGTPPTREAKEEAPADPVAKLIEFVQRE